MTPKQRAAMEQALDALVEINKLSVGEAAICLPAEIDGAMAAIRAALAEPQEPVAWAWVDLQNRADEIVRGKLLWKRFIDGTPLSNDIACWMADFAQEVMAPQPAKQPLTEAEIEAAVASVSVYRGEYTHAIARAIEAAHGIGETK